VNGTAAAAAAVVRNGEGEGGHRSCSRSRLASSVFTRQSACLECLTTAFRARRGDVGGHGAGEMFDVAAVEATPAQVLGLGRGQDAADPFARLLQQVLNRS
jgi:hypothetical protein